MFNMFREKNGTQEFVAKFETMEAAAEYVETAEAEGTWPEGWDAVAVNVVTAETFIYAETWEIII